MALAVGSRLGHYDVTALIGEGGMGQVYQATDTKLNRQVALKILPEAFAEDPDRLARFQREAQVLASLNHPNIAQIHGIEEADDTRALVLELVEVPTLADRIAQGPIPVDEALPIAKQIAEALEAAHEQGVIHRDLKPANIKVKDDGTVKVLDFGLAKALDTTPEGDPSQSPTLTAAATQMGVIMGTAAYMSPEQARGKPVDKRADIWAFGCVLYEMLTGQRAFQGEDVSLTLSTVLQRDPNWETLPAGLPGGLVTLLRRALEKDARQRLRDIGEARVGIGEASVASLTEGRSAPPDAVRGRRSQTAALLAVALGAVMAAFVAGLWSRDTPASGSPRYLSLPLAVGIRYNDVERTRPFAVSRNGRTVVYRGDAQGVGVLYRRDLDSVEAAPITGSEAGTAPFFSPDGRWLGYHSPVESVLKRVSLSGGAPETIAGIRGAFYGASWGADDTIVFATASTAGLQKVPAAGGELEAVTTLTEGIVAHSFPSFLPNNDHVLFEVDDGGDMPRVAVASLSTGVVTELGVRGRTPDYVQVGRAGYLVYSQANTLVALPFDPDDLQAQGVPVTVLTNVHVHPRGAAYAAFATDGTVIYANPVVGGQSQPAWVERDGTPHPIVELPTGTYLHASLAPDGSKAAFALQDPSGLNLLLYDFGTGGTRQLTGGSRNTQPVWSPDSRQIAFASNREGPFQLYVIDVIEGGEATRLLASSEDGVPRSWSPDGETLFYYSTDIAGQRDIYAYSFEDDTITRLVATEADERTPALSPDGRWLAYLSDESGSHEVYLDAYPNLDRVRRVSVNGGGEPGWASSSGELYYRSGDMSMVAVEVTSPSGDVGTPRKLFDDSFRRHAFMNTSYDVAEDGRFLMLRDTNPAVVESLNAVLGFAVNLDAVVSSEQQ